ncbi:AAA family ATPase [Flavobacterium ginsengiterrae]|uniref:AAA family ATPase n=1 Tax=Flavobacterium ginsengiterrae TaxID=871695 RepID=A0ABP7GMZ8_9FLAO
MIKITEIHIKGFKETNREVNIIFSKEPITVIYGENGSGKTTFLKIIYAIFNKDDSYLLEENVKEVKITYLLDQKKTKLNTIKIIGKKVDWGDNIKDLINETSILFGVNRGVIQNFSEEDESLHSKYTSIKWSDYYYLLDHNKKPTKKNKNLFSEDWDTANHISVDFIGINQIEESIIKQFRAGQRATSDKVKNAFFNTISNAVDIEMEQANYDLPVDFNERIEKKRNVLISLVEKLDKSGLQKKLLNYLDKQNPSSEIEGSKIFRVLLINILGKVEEENVELKSISKLIEIFNSHLYRNKRLIVTEEETFIEISKNNIHNLNKLSSGERHLLTFLTLFLIMGRNRSFFIIDEPEISLNMVWQRELIPLLSELSPDSQIIVATHSPSISHKNSNYLVKLV